MMMDMEAGQMGMMMLCMIGALILALLIAVTLVVQSVLQWKLLNEVRRLRSEKK